jgi:hypothetical protein
MPRRCKVHFTLPDGQLACRTGVEPTRYRRTHVAAKVTCINCSSTAAFRVLAAAEALRGPR